MQSNYIGVYEDTRPAWRRSVEQDLYHYANKYNIPIVVLYDFTRFLEYYIPDNFDYWKRFTTGSNCITFNDGKLSFQCLSINSPEVLKLTIGQDYGIEVIVENIEENKVITRFIVSVRNYYNETLKAIVKKLLKS